MLALLAGCSAPVPPDQDHLRQLVRDYVDRTRPTPAIGEVAASDQRPLPTWVWIGPSPGVDAPDRPLLLMLHGVDGHPEKFDAFASALAEAGTVVAAPAFPVSNGDNGVGGLALTDLPAQVEDVAFVLDHLVRDQADEGGPLWHRFDPERIVALGHSMGGATLLGHARYGGGDPRVRGQIYVSAAMQLQPLLGDEPMETAGPPTLVVTGSEDVAVPPAFAETLFDEIDEPKGFLDITGAEHSEALESQEPIPEQEALLVAVQGLLDTAVGGEPGAMDDALALLAAEGHEIR